MIKMRGYKLLLLLLFIFSRSVSFAQIDPIEHLWYNEEKTAKIQVYKAHDGKFYGKIAWLKDPDKNGKPKVDDKNPEASRRTQPILGLLILKGFSKNGNDKYADGTIYDPKNGKTYSCKITRNGKSLDVRGYIGLSIIGRTTRWTLAE
jgi:uncharacterized protein (DUF2147 family)